MSKIKEAFHDEIVAKADWIKQNYDGNYEMFIDPVELYAALKGDKK